MLGIRDSQRQWKHWNNVEYISGTVYTTEESRHWKGACNLGSLMLPSFVEFEQDKPKLNWYNLMYTIEIAVRMLDNIIDKSFYPDEDFADYQKNMRTIGLGITGLADMLILLGFEYGSKEAVLFTERLMNFIAYHAYKTSANLAEEKGPFPMFSRQFADSAFIESQIEFYNSSVVRDRSWRYDDRYDGLAQWVYHWRGLKDKVKYTGIRNARIMSVAPTGTMSMVFGNNCSSGLEPIFMLEQDRWIKMKGQSNEDKELYHLENPVWKVFKEGKLPHVTEDLFVTALDLPVEKHVAMLEAVAKHVDMSCSKTINIPEDYSFEDTKQVYMECWKRGIKGCTIFRPNKLREGIFVTDKKEETETVETPPAETTSEDTVLPRGAVIQVDDNVIGRERHLTTGCGTLHFQAYFDPDTGDLVETYASRGSQGGCNSYMVGLSRMISLAARAGTPVDAIVDQLLSTPPCIAYNNRSRDKGDTSKGMSCGAAMGYALRDMVAEIHESIVDEENESEYIAELKVTNEFAKVAGEAMKKANLRLANDISICPDCGDELTFEGGCNVCKSCGWSKCG